MKALLVAIALIGLNPFQPMALAEKHNSSAKAAHAADTFNTIADKALAAMRQRAEGMNVTGVAVVAYFEGDTIQAWTSKMVVVGKLTTDPTATEKGSNLLGIAYAKACEMAATLKNSGTADRPPLTGEFGWTGGAIERTTHGYVIAAFSGGKSEDDLAISREGLAELKRVR